MITASNFKIRFQANALTTGIKQQHPNIRPHNDYSE